MTRRKGRAKTAAKGADTGGASGSGSAPNGAANSVRPLPTPNGAITYERWRSKYLREYHGGLYVAHNDNHRMLPADAVTVSEATGYGLLVSVLAGNRSDFDRLITFHRYFLLPSGLMYWQLLRRNGEIHANVGTLNSATDADMDIAFALFTAAKVWGVPEFKRQAIVICAALLAQCYNEETQVMTLGDWCVEGHDLRRVARSSDFLPSHLTLFAEEDTAHAATWTACLEATLKALEAQLEQNPTGLMADFVAYNPKTDRYEPVLGKVLERVGDPHYNFNSCRIPWRLAVYYAETGNERVLPILRALVAFFEGQEKVYAGYTLEGKSLVRYSHLSFSAPVCCMLKVMESPHLDRMKALMYSLGEGSYFGDTIQLLCDMQTADFPNCHPN